MTEAEDAQPSSKTDSRFWARWNERPTAAACFVCGLVAVLVLFGRQVALDDLLGTPPLTHSLPFVGVAVALAVASIIRKERAIEHLLFGLGLAVAGIFLGWVLAGALAIAFLWLLVQLADILG